MAELKRVNWTDDEGRKKVVLLPLSASEDEAPNGIPVGPPNLSDLELPLATEVRLNNELFYRGILTGEDAYRHRNSISEAIQATLKLDTERVFATYVNKEERRNVKREQAEKPTNNNGNRARARSNARPAARRSQ